MAFGWSVGASVDDGLGFAKTEGNSEGMLVSQLDTEGFSEGCELGFVEIEGDSEGILVGQLDTEGFSEGCELGSGEIRGDPEGIELRSVEIEIEGDSKRYTRRLSGYRGILRGLGAGLC